MTENKTIKTLDGSTLTLLGTSDLYKAFKK